MLLDGLPRDLGGVVQKNAPMTGSILYWPKADRFLKFSQLKKTSAFQLSVVTVRITKTVHHTQFKHKRHWSKKQAEKWLRKQDSSSIHHLGLTGDPDWPSHGGHHLSSAPRVPLSTCDSSASKPKRTRGERSPLHSLSPSACLMLTFSPNNRKKKIVKFNWGF